MSVKTRLEVVEKGADDRAMVWFRSDLRVSDNTALLAACSGRHAGVVGVFAITQEEWRIHDVAPVRVEFMLRTLVVLKEKLAKVNIPLLIVRSPRAAETARLIVKVAQRHQCRAIYANREYEVNEAARDADVERLGQELGIQVRLLHDQTVMPPGRVLTGEGRPYTVFTPFKRNWIKQVGELMRPYAAGEPVVQPKVDVSSDDVPDRVEGFTSSVPAELWPAGEVVAQRRLSEFAESRMSEYKVLRDVPSLMGTSGMSPYLTVGAISPRQCLDAAVTMNQHASSPLDQGNEGAVHWISELCWREFYVHVMTAFPRVCKNRAFQPATEAIAWNEDPQAFEAWAIGKTGVPIVDAGMRQLLATGWMHNRVRMVTAMFFSKNLFLDWRLGERHFMRHLIDGNLASNNGGWQWSSSTGTDAAPYFRIFNPLSQSERFDPEGEYIRRWVPELKLAATRELHETSTKPRRGGYPAAIVDLSTSRAKAIAAFKGIRGGA